MLKIKSKANVVTAAAVKTFVVLSVIIAAMRLFFAADVSLSLQIATALALAAIVFPVSLWIFAQMLKGHHLAKSLRLQVNRDHLTDVATRDYFFKRLEQNENCVGVLLMIDINSFKKINDVHGHLAGDEVIQSVAKTIQAQIRKQDIVCRFGGEEFVVFLAEASPREAWFIAERIRAIIAASCTTTKGVDLRVTVSVGGSLKQHAETLDASIERADSCMYRAKEAGRNQTVVDWARRLEDPLRLIAS